MMDYLPDILNFIVVTIQQYWSIVVASSVLSAFLALIFLDRALRIFDILRR